MRSILLQIDHDAGLEARLQASLDLVRASDGHLTCLQVVRYEVTMPGDIYGMMPTNVGPILQENADKLRTEIEKRLHREDVRWDWVQLAGWDREHFSRRSSLADVVVVGAHEPVESAGRPAALVGDLAVHSRTPLLLVPDHTRGFNLSGTALVAWNGSVEAGHALRAAVPLLRQARSVILATVNEKNVSDRHDLPQTTGAEYLARHDIECELIEVPMTEGSVADALAAAAAAHDASFMVIGAYGHTRAFEAVFGGVTRKLLAAPPLPILAAH